MPAALARSAMARPTARAVSMVAVPVRPDAARGLNVAGALEPFGQCLLQRRGGGQHLPALAVEQLRIDVAWGAMHRQPHQRQLANACPGLHGAALAPLFFRNMHDCLAALLLLALFEDDLLIRVAHTLAFVGLGWTDAANLGRGLTDSLPIVALDQYLGLARRLDRDALRNRVIHRMRET